MLISKKITNLSTLPLKKKLKKKKKMPKKKFVQQISKKNVYTVVGYSDSGGGGNASAF